MQHRDTTATLTLRHDIGHGAAGLDPAFSGHHLTIVGFSELKDKQHGREDTHCLSRGRSLLSELLKDASQLNFDTGSMTTQDYDSDDESLDSLELAALGHFEEMAWSPCSSQNATGASDRSSVSSQPIHIPAST